MVVAMNPLALTLAALTTIAAPGPPPDAIWLGGSIYTVDAAFSRAEALALRPSKVKLSWVS